MSFLLGGGGGGAAESALSLSTGAISGQSLSKALVLWKIPKKNPKQTAELLPGGDGL